MGTNADYKWAISTCAVDPTVLSSAGSFPGGFPGGFIGSAPIRNKVPAPQLFSTSKYASTSHNTSVVQGVKFGGKKTARLKAITSTHVLQVRP